jgi:octaprenyl-diphosphate synthase
MPVRKISASASGRDIAGPMAELFAPAAKPLERVRRRLCECLSTPDEGVNQQIETIGAGRGKMLRPALVLLSGLACGKLRREHIELAAMIEMIHTATLLHDDVIDQAEKRRNHPTVNRLWGNTAAVLLGDFLLSRAFLAGAELKTPQAQKILGQTAQRICLGELLQNIRRADWTMDQEDYLDIIEAKTASLFSTACRLGAMASGADPATAENFAAYGRCVGLAFQITDDILDITGNGKKTGKTMGTDFSQGKPTLPVIHFLKQQNPTQRKTAVKTFSRELKPKQLVQILNDSNSLDYARDVAENFAAKAVKMLSVQKTTKIIESLKTIALAVGNRA